jgi:hypothetical protein
MARAEEGKWTRGSVIFPDQIRQLALPSFPLSPPTTPGRRCRGVSEREGKTQNPSTPRPVADGRRSREMAVDEVNSVYVGGLPYEANEEMLRDAFGYYGTIVSVKVRPAPLPLLFSV